MAGMIVRTQAAMRHLGEPSYALETGSICENDSRYMRRWDWPCGCRGEIIAGSLIELVYCEAHRR